MVIHRQNTNDAYQTSNSSMSLNREYSQKTCNFIEKYSQYITQYIKLKIVTGFSVLTSSQLYL